MGKNYANSANELWTDARREGLRARRTSSAGFARACRATARTPTAGIEGGYIYAALGHVTGQSTIAFASVTAGTQFSNFVTAWNAGKMIGFASKQTTPSGSSVVGSHAYAVVGYNASTQTVTLYNPWGPEYGTGHADLGRDRGSFSYFDRTA